MKLLPRIFVFVAMATSAGCLKSTNFQCDTSAQCGAGGQCEGDGFCSFPSSSCASGRAYGDNSGPNSGECVGGTGGDGGTEPVPGDMGGSEPLPSNCPATGYDVLPNSGPRGRKYKLLDTPATWPTHRDFCAATDGTFMAFPDGTNLANAQLELAALRVLAGDGAWVGVNDLTTEGSYRTSLNQAVSASTAGLITTMGNPNATDCLVINTTTLDDADCTTARKAVCECVP